ISWRRSSSTRSVRWLIGRRPSAGHAADGLVREALDDVALDEVVEPGEADAALEVLGHFADVVPEPPERLDPVGLDDLAAPPDARAAIADDAPIGDVAPGDHRALADAEDLADLRAALDHLDHLGLEHALEGRVDVVGELVDDVVDADVDPLALRRAARGLGDRGVEADDDRVRRRRQHDVVV